MSNKVIEPSGRRRSVAALIGALAAGAILSASAVGVDARPSVVLAQSATPASGPSSAASVGDGLGSHPTISGDGRYVAFQGPPGLVGGPVPGDDRTTTVYLTDRGESVTTELTTVPEGVRPGDSVAPVISGDGCTIVVVTEMALDVFRDDDAGDRWDVYRSRLPNCDGAVDGWELVSTLADGSGLARDDVVEQAPAVSRNGTVIAYTHPATQLIESANLTSVTLVDLTQPVDSPNRSVLAAGTPVSSPDTQFVNAGLDEPALSGDGRYLAYRSDATSTDAVAGWGGGTVPGGPATRQVYVWDREEPDPFLAVHLVSARPDGTPSVAGAGEPTVSRDGRVIAFTSADAGLVPAVFPTCTDSCPTQVYRLDRDTDDNGWLDEAGRTALTLLSAQPGTDPLVAGTAPSSQPTLTTDGQLVAFITKAPNLQLIKASGGGEATDGDLLVADARSDDLRRVAFTADGVQPALAAHSHPHFSDTGRTIVFDTLAAGQLLPDITSTGRQVVTMTLEPSLSLADADLGTTLVGLQSDEWFVGVINDGPTAFEPSRITVSDPHFEINQESSTCALGVIVPAGGDCTVRLAFTPSAPGPISAKLTVSEQGFQAISVSSRVTGSGGDPTLRTDPAGADLGLVDVGQSSAEFQFDVKNISLVPTSVASVEVSGAQAGDFAVTSNSCAGHPLNPHATCSLGVTFSPTAPGRRTALIEIATPTGQYTSMVAAGDARYRPELKLLVGEIDAGGSYIAGGTGYPPNSEVSIVFGDGDGDTVKATTNEAGKFLVQVPVAADARGGERTIVVQAADGTAASARVDVVQHDAPMIGMPGFGLGG